MPVFHLCYFKRIILHFRPYRLYNYVLDQKASNNEPDLKNTWYNKGVFGNLVIHIYIFLSFFLSKDKKWGFGLSKRIFFGNENEIFSLHYEE